MLNSSKVWARQLCRGCSNDCKTFRWQTDEKASHKGRTPSPPYPPWAFLISDVSSTPVININLGGWGQHLPAPHRLCSAGLSAALPGKAGGESLSWQLVSQGWGRLCYTTLTFGVESSAKSKPTRIHQQLGTAAALVLCSPPLPFQSREDAGKFMKLHSAWCSADYPQHQTRLCFGQPVLEASRHVEREKSET